MIIRLKTANFSENNIGELNKFTVRVHGSGLASYEANSPVNKGETATIKVIVNSDFITDDITVKMSGSVITPSITSTGTNEYTITIPNVTGRIEVLVGDVVSGGGSEGGEGNGVWLSELITGDSNAHSAFMAVPNHTATLSSTPDYIYHTSEIQSLLSGKTITRVACANLAPGKSITFYSNPWSTGTLTKDGRTEIGTITGSSSAQAAGTSMATYSINAPVKSGESLAFKASSGVVMVGYGQLDFVTPVRYAYNKDTYDSALGEFIAFDFYLEG